MHIRYRCELIIERMAAPRACRILEEAGLTGYTVLPAISGFGGTIRWSRDTDMSASSDMVVVISIGARTQIDTALEEIERLLSTHIGVLSVGEVKVLRPERF